MKDFSFSFYSFEMSLKFRVNFFFDFLRIKDSTGKETAPSFMTMSKFYVKA